MKPAPRATQGVEASGPKAMDKFEGNFRLIDRCDVSAIKSRVHALTEADWESVQYRQKRFETHKDTQSIGLVFDEDFRHENPTKRDKYFELDCDSLLAPLIETVADYYTGEGYIVRAMLVRLKAGGEIPTHIDTGYSLMAARRIHVPIESNDEVTFTVGDERRVMKEGELWEINNARIHSVTNASDRPRVHLIVDWVPT